MMRGALVAMLLLMGVAPAFAQDTQSVDATLLDQAARVHYQLALQSFRVADYEAALREFQEAYRLSQRSELLYNISGCYERLGDLPHAIEYLERFVRDTSDEAQRAQQELRLATLRARLAREEAAEAAPESSDETAPGAPPVPIQTEPAPAVGPSGVLVAGGVLLGLAAASGVSLGITGGLALAEESTLAQRCGSGAAASCTEADVSGLRGLMIGADVSLAATLTLGVAGAVLAIAGASEGAPTSAALVPFVAPGTAGIAAHLRF